MSAARQIKSWAVLAQALVPGGLLLIMISCLSSPAPILVATWSGRLRACRSPEEVVAVRVSEGGQGQATWQSRKFSSETIATIFELLETSITLPRPEAGILRSLWRDNHLGVRIIFSDSSTATFATVLETRGTIDYDEDRKGLSRRLRLKNEKLTGYLREFAERQRDANE